MTATHFEPLGELYIGTLVSNAHFGGGARTIADAIIAALWRGPGETSWPTARDKARLTDGAEKLTHDAMGLLEAAIGTLNKDWLDGLRDWYRLDSFWNAKFDSPEKEALEAVWVFDQLTRATAQAWDDYAEHCNADWAHDISRAADYFGASALLVKEAFQIKEVSR